MFSYTVQCTFESHEVADQWLRWLIDDHVQDVIDCGARAAEIFEMESLSYEIRYRFESKESFDEYESNHAPRLRELGLKNFPLSMGLKYTRTTGRRLHSFGVG